MDAHYTPRALAAELIATASDIRPSVVADLCAGRGDLLLQAEALWPTACFAAVDIDPRAVSHLSRLRPHWQVGRCDLRKSRSRASSPVLKRVRKRISLLLLNPPFSCRGNKRFKANTPSGPIYASNAMSFLITSLAYLHPNGSVVAVLPIGALYCQKDRVAWAYIRTTYTVVFVAFPQRGAFPGSAASVAVVRLSPLNERSTVLDPPSAIRIREPSLRVGVIRGCQPIYRINSHADGPVLVHSTDLRNGQVCLNGRRGINARRPLAGSAVLLPRVGQLTDDKIALFHSNDPIVLSDCVIGLTTNDLTEAQEVRERIVKSFSVLTSQYVGTGAPFVTLRRLQKALSLLGIEPHGS